MALTVTLYTISDPAVKVSKTLPSSTKRDVTGVLLEEVEDITAPMIEFDSGILTSSGSQANFYTANYAYISAFSRYYFITDKIIVDNDHIVMHFRVDVLKTYSVEIDAATLFVSRSQSAGSWDIPDPSVPMQANMTMTSAILNSFTPFDIDPDTSNENNCPVTFVLCAAGTKLSTTPQQYIKNGYECPNSSASYWSLNEYEVRDLAAEICGGQAAVSHWFEDLQSGVFGLKAFPFNIPHEAADLTGVHYGDVSLGTVSGYPLKSTYYQTSYKSTVGTNYGPLAMPTDFRRSSGQYVIRIFLPFVGWQQLEPEVFNEKPYLNVEYKTNLLTGTGVCTVYALGTANSSSAASDIVAQYEYVAGIDVPLTISDYREKMKTGVETSLTTALAIGGSLLTKNPALIGSALSTGAMANAAAWSKPVSYGQLGSSSSSNNPLYPQKITLQYRIQDSPVLDNNTQKTAYAAQHGLMCQKTLTLSSLSGMTVADASLMDIPSKCTDPEYQEIVNLLAKGVIL